MSNMSPQNNFMRVLLILEQHQLSKYGGCTGCKVAVNGNPITIERHQADLLQALRLIKPDATGTMGVYPTRT